jgi:hypothetical protein
MKTKRLSCLSAVLTSFAYRPQYEPLLHNMLGIARKYHPSWPAITGSGPLSGDEGSLSVHLPWAREKWNLPVALRLDESENDWRKITMMKGWWLQEVWKSCGQLFDSGIQRVVWMDADSRLNRPLDFEIDPDVEMLAGPWWDSTEENYPMAFPYATIASGMLVFQGRRTGPVEKLLDRWSHECLAQIEDLSAPTVPWLNGDQELLTDSIAYCTRTGHVPQILKLEYKQFCGLLGPGSESPSTAAVDHWVMSRKMKSRETREMVWPPTIAGTDLDPTE